MAEQVDVRSTLNERQSSHGSFVENAHTVNTFIQLCKLQPQWKNLDPVQQEGLEMMIRKLIRVLVGDAKLLDSWRDMIGYLQLVVEHMSVTPGTRDVQNTKITLTEEGWKSHVSNGK